MKLFSITYCILVVMIHCFSLQAIAGQGALPAETENHARISIPKKGHDFGSIMQGESVSTHFIYRNTGSKVLNIYKTIVSIKNINIQVSHKALDPGQEGTITLTLDSSNLFGNVRGQVTLITNDQDQSKRFLLVTAHVQPILALDPPFFFVGRLAQKRSFASKAKLIGKLVEERKINHFLVRPSSPSIEAKIHRKMVKGEKIAFLEFVLLPEMKAGSFRESITILSEDPPAQAQLLLFGQKLGEIRFTPDKLVFLINKGTQMEPLSVVFECEKPFHITKAEDQNDLLDLSVATIEKEKKYELKAILESRAESFFIGVVKVYTDFEQHPIIHIPYVVKVN